MAKRHPECGSDEVFLTNAGWEDFDNIGWKTKRTGDIAYYLNGKPIPKMPNDPWYNTDNDFFPVFVQKQELIDAGIDMSHFETE